MSKPLRKRWLFVVVAMVLSSTWAMADDFMTFNDSQLGQIDVYSLDWTPGNSLAVDAVPLSEDPANPTHFQQRYQAALGSFLDGNGSVIGGTGLNVEYEITAVAVFGETGSRAFVNTDGDSFIEIENANFVLDPSASENYVEIYLDTNRNANALAGTGYNDGTLLMRGVVTAANGQFSAILDTNGDNVLDVAILDAFLANNYPSVGTLTGTGSSTITALIDASSINTDYFPGTWTANLNFFLNTTLTLPFYQQNPSASVLGVAPEFGQAFGSFDYVNGLSKADSGQMADILFQADANSSISTPCVDIEKQVSVDGLPLLVAGGPTGWQWNPAKVWFDADVWASAPTTGLAATYRLIVTNCGNAPLTGVTLNDIAPTSTIPEKIVFEDVNIGDLQPSEIKVITAGWIGQATTGPVTPISGFAGLDAPTRCQDSWVSVDGSPDGMYLNTAEVTTDQGVSDEDPAWVSCRREELGACRMTGGSVTVNNFLDADGDAMVFYSYVDGTSADATQTIGKGKNATGTWVTTGGQIGAPSTDPATGHWEHTQHAGAAGNFTFLAGTASAPPGTEISNIDCADPGWCVQARCAPFKQIFWDGTGYFPNKHGGEDFNASFPDSTCTVTPGGPQKDGTLHYFHAMVGDFGENDRKNRQPNNSTCDWPAPSSYDVELYTPLEAVTDDQFGDKGGQVCDKCADYYQIQIFCGATEATKGEVIYTFESFIDGGNFQIHPETSEQCTADLFAPTTSTR